MARQALQGLPFIDASYYSSAVAAARRIVREQGIDAIEVNSTHLAFFRRFLPQVPGILLSHNIEADIFPFWMPAGLTGWKLRFMEWVASRWNGLPGSRAAKAVEIDNAFGFSAMTFISRHDMSRVTDKVPRYLMLHFPLGTTRFEDKPDDVFHVLWMGGFGWYPNAEAVTWFAEKIHPLLAGQLQERKIVLHFCGGNPPEALQALHDGRNVLVHGFVDDLQSLLDKAHLLMVPLLSGGGIRVKIVEAMSAGIPVLSTSKGARASARPTAWTSWCVMTQKGLPVHCWNARRTERDWQLCRRQGRISWRAYSQQASLDAKRAAYRHAGVM